MKEQSNETGREIIRRRAARPETVFYVTVVDKASNAGHTNRMGALLGPYDTLAEAQANVERGRQMANEVNCWAWFYSYGVMEFKSTAVAKITPVFGK